MVSSYEILQRGGHLGRSHLWEAPLLVWTQDLSKITSQQLYFRDRICPKFPNQILGEEAPSKWDEA